MFIILTDKYNNDIFYMLPYYHLLFPQLKKLIVLDCDVQVKPLFECMNDPLPIHAVYLNTYLHAHPQLRDDITVVQGVFNKFTGRQLIGVGNDLAPHYFQMLSRWGHTSSSFSYVCFIFLSSDIELIMGDLELVFPASSRASTWVSPCSIWSACDKILSTPAFWQRKRSQFWQKSTAWLVRT